jgi:acetyl esterase/lipase
LLRRYRWLRDQGWKPEHIVLASDSAGGYLSLTLAERVLDDGEVTAAMVYISPLMQLAQGAKLAHRNVRTDAMLSAKVAMST